MIVLYIPIWRIGASKLSGAVDGKYRARESICQFIEFFASVSITTKIIGRCSVIIMPYHCTTSEFGNKHIPQYYGLVETDLGKGSAPRLMRDFDGNISITLYQRLLNCRSQGGLDKNCRDSLEELKLFLKATGFSPGGLKLKNILSVRLSKHQERLYIIDDIGFREWIPLAKWCRPLAQHKINKRIAKLEERVRRIVGLS